MRRASLVVILILCSATASARKWTDSSGSFSIDAEYRGVEDDAVILEKRGAKTMRVPLAKLSPRDQEYVWARRTLKSVVGAGGMENVSALSEAFSKTVAELLKAGGVQAETGVKRELVQAERRTEVEAAVRRVCDTYAGKPFTVAFPITDVRHAKYVPNVPQVVGGLVVLGPRWRPAGPDDYELLVGRPRGVYAAEIKAPGIFNVKMSPDQAQGIGRESVWVMSGAARLRPGEARLAEGRLVVDRGDPPVAAIAAPAKTGSSVSCGILIYLDNQRTQLKHGPGQEKAASVKKPDASTKRKK